MGPAHGRCSCVMVGWVRAGKHGQTANWPLRVAAPKSVGCPANVPTAGLRCNLPIGSCSSSCRAVCIKAKSKTDRAVTELRNFLKTNTLAERTRQPGHRHSRTRQINTTQRDGVAFFARLCECECSWHPSHWSRGGAPHAGRESRTGAP